MVKKSKRLKGCKKRGNWWHCPVTPTPRIDKRSIRTVKRGRNLIRVGCPVGKWSTGAPRGKQCRTGMKAISILKPVT